jgi:hypothetical protein
MSRRLILAACLVAVVGGGAGVASATAPVETHPHQLCVVLAKDADHEKTQYYCVNWWAPEN